MEIKKRVSVIVPIYNTKEFLAKCLDSILQQTYPNIEIILVDNGSTDGSGSIAKEYAKKTSQIKYVYKEHGNISSARNLGLNYVEGQYVGFVDSDDWIEKSMYEKLVYAMENNEADLTVCSFCKQTGEKVTVMQNEKQIEENVFQNEMAIKYAFIRDEYRAFCAYIWNKLFKAEIIEQEKFDDVIKNLKKTDEYKITVNKNVWGSIELGNITIIQDEFLKASGILKSNDDEEQQAQPEQ